MSQASNLTGSTVGDRYILVDSLGQGGMGTVYEALDRMTGGRVALKQVNVGIPGGDSLSDVSTGSMGDSTHFRLALAREFRTLASLRHPNIISVLDYGFAEDLSPYYTMELIHDSRSILKAAGGLSLVKQTDFLIQLLQALAYLHRRGIVHRDLKPDNVLVHENTVRVLDFGLAVARGGLEDDSTGFAGTLNYVAPEVLKNQPASERSDLYAVGVIAFELFAGQHPFHREGSNVAQTITTILTEPAPIDWLDVEPGLAAVIGRALGKSPEERFDSASEMITAIARVTGRPDLVQETEAIRESFLQAARFVGRDAEMRALTTALHDARKGQGSAWLVGGESGVGKTRLLEELRTQALVDGMLVLSGGATQEGQAAYQLWRDILRRLALHTELDPLEARVLKPLVTDIARLVGHDVTDAPVLDPALAQERLFNVVEGLYARQNDPVVILLEDLHWSRGDSITLLTRLVERSAFQPLMIIATFRDDERPDIPGLLPDMNLLSLGRLTTGQITELSQSILGQAGTQPELIRFLERETEGNVFFLVEVMRALAEESGTLAEIGRMALPQNVVAGGIQQIINRRLERVADLDRPLLELAAVAGSQLDLALLRQCAPHFDVDRWLTSCQEAAVIAVQEGAFRFAHNKLRDGVLSSLSDVRKRASHQAVAEGIEAVYQDAEEMIPALAYHWGQAGKPEKEVGYAARAGEIALHNGAYNDALTSLQRAHELAQELNLDIDTRGRFARLLGETYLATGNVPRSRETLEGAAEVMGRPVPLGFSLYTNMAWQAGRQILHRLKDGGIGRYSDLQKARMKETARVYALLGQMYYYDRGSSTLGIYSGLYSLNLAERVGPSPELANAYANMQGGLTLASGSLAKLVEIYGRRALETAQSINDQPSLVWALITSAFYWMGAGKWGLAERYAAQAAEVGERVGNYRQWAEALTILSQVHYFQGKYRESWKVNDRIKALVERTNNLAHRRWTLSMIALNALRMGEHAVAIDAVQQSLRITQESLPDDYYYFETYSLIALGMTFKGDLNEAEGYADRALKAMPEFAAASSIRVEIYGALASTYLTLAESAGESGKRADYLAQADRALQMARENAKIFPISGSPVALYEGCLLAIRGDLDKARKFWELASQKAAPYPLPYEMGRAQTLLGSSYPPASAERQRHLLEAQRIFNEIGATYDLDLVTHGLHEG